MRDLPILKEEINFCSDFMMGKQHRESILKKAKWRSTKKLELIHIDLLKKFRAVVEGESGCKIQCLRTDRE